MYLLMSYLMKRNDRANKVTSSLGLINDTSPAILSVKNIGRITSKIDTLIWSAQSTIGTEL